MSEILALGGLEAGGFGIFFLMLILAVYLAIKSHKLNKQQKQCNIDKQVMSASHAAKIDELMTIHADKQKLIDGYIVEIGTLQAGYDSLRKYSNIPDAEKEADRIKAEAKHFASSIKDVANDYVNSIRSETIQWSNKTKQEAQSKLEKAEFDAKQLIDAAKKEAQVLAGSALAAKDKAELYQKAAVAMKNRIDGYGDEYIIPNHDLLADLAEQYEHKDAGVKLKEAHTKTKNLIKQQLAATCDYVEDNRRTTAIRFVLDAFNGKVDTILTKVKHDNYGKLKQSIDDAYHLVNIHGKPFRDARILPAYLNARINELEWAVRVHELRQQELEEQRLIRDQLREEEKARRDYERAMKEAEKEERMLQKAMEEARKHYESAKEEDKQQYQIKMLELEQKLREAEEKNQRALSMAQQTKRGHVYVISNIGSFGENIYKIGLTRRLEPMDRVKELGDASVPFSFDVHTLIHSEDAPRLEYELHRRFANQQVNRVNPRKEFFNLSLLEIRQAIEALGIEVRWTMLAEAAEYRESQAMKRRREVIAPVEPDIFEELEEA